jgi:hypothetical protein
MKPDDRVVYIDNFGHETHARVRRVRTTEAEEHPRLDLHYWTMNDNMPLELKMMAALRVPHQSACVNGPCWRHFVDRTAAQRIVE